MGMVLKGRPTFEFCLSAPFSNENGGTNMINLDIVWVLLAGVLVYFMQAGFAMVEAGFTRAKNASNIIMKNLMDFAIGSLAFYLIGFGIMFGADYFGFVGVSGFF